MKNIVCFGEVLWDILPTGPKLGGAPVNVALRVQSLGNKAVVISAIGNDSYGKKLVEEIKAYEANLEHIQVNESYETSQVLVQLDAHGSASYEIKMPCAWDDIKLLDKDIEAVKASDAFIFGSLIARSETSRETLFSLLQSAAFKVFDVNLRTPHYTQENLLHLIKQADFVKFNDDELYEICGNLGFKNKSAEECIKFIADYAGVSQICVTLGEEGAILFRNNTFYYNKGYKIAVVDTVGAGDSFLATLISQLLNGSKPQKAIDMACAVGAIVASKSGANPLVTNIEIERFMQDRKTE